MTEDIKERKQQIAKRKKQFFALVLGVLIAVMPAANVMAETVVFHDNSVGTSNNGKALYVGQDAVRWNITGVIATGRLRVEYYYNGNKVGQEEMNRLIPTGDEAGIEVTNPTNIRDLDHWQVFGYTDFPSDSYTTVSAGVEPAPFNGGYTWLTVKLRAVLKSKAEKKDDKKEDDDDGDRTPFIYNPDAIAAYYYKKGVRQVNAIIGKQKQSDLAESVFASSVPAGWHSAFSMSMSVDGKNEYSLKDGTIVLCVPDAYLKAGRQYAFLAMDKSGKVFKLDDEDKNPNTVTVTPNIEGYAYVLIYKD